MTPPLEQITLIQEKKAENTARETTTENTTTSYQLEEDLSHIDVELGLAEGLLFYSFRNWILSLL